MQRFGAFVHLNSCMNVNLKNMKKIFTAWIIVACSTACVYEIPELPDETQNGANTFGCLVNGELVVPYPGKFVRYSYDYKTQARYDKVSDRLQIIGYGQNYQSFSFTINRPQSRQSMSIDSVAYCPYSLPYSYVNEGDYYYGGTGLGEIVFTRFDLIEGIVSGKFHFVGYKRNAITGGLLDPDDFVTVSLGRFDIKLTVN